MANSLATACCSRIRARVLTSHVLSVQCCPQCCRSAESVLKARLPGTASALCLVDLFSDGVAQEEEGSEGSLSGNAVLSQLGSG